MKVYAFSDIHGQGELFDLIVEFMERDRTQYLCYFLGDACDRGPDGYRIMEHLLANPEKFVYIKGNHEDMFVRAAREFIKMAEEEGYTPSEFAARYNWRAEDVMFGGSDMYLHWRNGGETTFASWMKAGCPIKILHQLDELPLMEELSIQDGDVDNVTRIYDMCHAGCKMQEWNDEVEDALLWDRDHFFQEWKFETDGVPHILIHGHTPIPHMPTHFRKENGMKSTKPLRYNNGTKIDLDTACFHSGVVNLFDIGEDVFFTFYRSDIIKAFGADNPNP